MLQMKTKHTLLLLGFLTTTSQATLIIGPGVRNGSFEADTGKQTSWDTVTDWTNWDVLTGGPSTANNDSGTDNGGAATEGARVAFLQPNNAAFNMTTSVLGVGDVLTYQWDWTLPGRGDAEVSLAYLDGANVINFGPTSINPDTTSLHADLGGTYTVQAGDAWIGKQVGLTIVQGAGQYPEVDNFRLDLVSVPEPSSTALLGLGGLALIMRRRK